MLSAYDYEAKAISEMESAQNSSESLPSGCEYSVYLYLSKEENSLIEYGDFAGSSLSEEAISLFAQDGYIDANGNITDKVGEHLCWQVWIKFSRNDEIYSAVHVFDYTDNGVEFKREIVDVDETIEE